MDRQAETPMADHLIHFWNLLATEHVRILVNIRKAHEPGSGVMYHWDSASFPDDVAKALWREHEGKNVEFAAGLFFKTRGDKHNLPQIIGPLEQTEDTEWPWLAIVCGQPWLWSATGVAGSIPLGERGPHARDLVENVSLTIGQGK